jgi:hypothetical protein
MSTEAKRHSLRRALEYASIFEYGNQRFSTVLVSFYLRFADYEGMLRD